MDQIPTERRYYPHHLTRIEAHRGDGDSGESTKIAAMKLGNTLRPTASSPLLVSFPPLALILATSSSNSLPHLAAAAFWRMTLVE
jgi:hypothetical protein